MSGTDSSSREFFEQKYRVGPDPWSFATSAYERRRYDTIMQHVDAGRFEYVFEPGCSIGVFTAQLANRCGHVVAIDIAEAAVTSARRRCARLGNVEVRQGAVPDDIPNGPFDLIVFSEIGYYFDEKRLGRLARDLSSRICDAGHLIAVHWTGESTDHLVEGSRVHEVLDERLGMEHLTHEDHPPDTASPCDDGFVLDVWELRRRGRDER